MALRTGERRNGILRTPLKTRFRRVVRKGAVLYPESASMAAVRPQSSHTRCTVARTERLERCGDKIDCGLPEGGSTCCCGGNNDDSRNGPFPRSHLCSQDPLQRPIYGMSLGSDQTPTQAFCLRLGVRVGGNWIRAVKTCSCQSIRTCN